jgi:adenosine deaminase
MTADVPKAELHVHLEGTAPPVLIRALAERNGLEVPAGLIGPDGRFAWRDFLHFLERYDLAAGTIRTARDYRDVTYAYLASAAAEGTVYAELTASPEHAAAVGLSEAGLYAGVAEGIDDARRDHGIEARILVAVLRDLGPERALALARRTAAERHPSVVGLSLVGDEAGHPADAFAPAYRVAAGEGLGCTAHAGEHAGPESVRAALGLPVTRLSHGVRAIEDPEVVAELASRGIVLEICPTSNVALGVYPSYAAHPLRALRDAGVPVTLGSDDPPYFEATIGGEYAVAARHFGFDRAALGAVTRTAIEASFAEDILKRALLERLPSAGARAGSMLRPPRPRGSARPA